jgi:hypothetical protein
MLCAAGDSSFLVGANLPWITYGCDFGANAWQPHGGLACPATRAHARQLLANLADAGAHAIRWFVLADGRAGLRMDSHGRLLGLDDRFFPDFDTALDLLRQTGLRAIFVLLDFRWFSTASVVEGVRTGGRTRLLACRPARRRLLDTVVGPILDRYGEDRSILAWDLINEPEWATTWRPFLRRGRLSGRLMRAYVREATGLVHERTRQLATVGLASAASLPLVAGLGLDFYQVHWYDHLPPRFNPARRVRELAADRPVLLGEFPTRGSAHTPRAIFDAARASGYSGAFAWSVVRQDEASDRHALEAAIRQCATA